MESVGETPDGVPMGSTAQPTLEVAQPAGASAGPLRQLLLGEAASTRYRRSCSAKLGNSRCPGGPIWIIVAASNHGRLAHILASIAFVSAASLQASQCATAWVAHG